ncbi:hypothetical protein SAMN05660443_0264 [Marinospirillum celere]|uniref:Uncharacterized protein n=1 Tax=Marinospirillum celere TaxID=1122252 RepID=A0A1I1E1M1_9GAMM|nr:hypothetical protein [Marinospirillum celere]SFB80967.1 hypothetical protein SAMN05660443_0264 [Marinospirillum celere]
MIIKPADLPAEARLTMSQQATTSDQGINLSIRGTGWVPPDFGDVDWSQPVTLEPVGPVPGDLATVTGRFRFEISTDLESQQVTWSINSEQAAFDGDDDSPIPDQTTSISIGLLQNGWTILRASDGSAIPMMAYGKRRVQARGTGTPPVSPGALTTAAFGGVSIYVTDFDVDSVQQTWSISGEEQ